MFCAEDVTRPVALSRCEAQGMRLAWLETPEENAGVRESIALADVDLPAGNPDLLTQVGATDSGDEGEWLWVGSAVAPDGFQFWEGGAASDDGQAVNGAFAGWSTNEPDNASNEDCAAMTVLGNNATNRDPGEWGAHPCTQPLPFACETP
jgi:hypothetical protein